MSSPIQTIPESELFWAVLTHSPTVGGARPRTQILRHTEELDGLFAEFLPVLIETVKPAYIALDAHRTLAAAAPRERLVGLINSDTIAATPAMVPAAVLCEPGAEAFAANLNFLWGDLEPRPVAREKRRATAVAAGVILLLTTAATLGLERRTAALYTTAAIHQTHAEAALKDLYHKPTTDAAVAALDLELSRLARTRAPRSTTPADAADALESLLSAWPRAARNVGAPKLRTESLTATPESLTLSVVLEDRSDATPLSDGLRAMPGWKLFQPQFSAAPTTSSTANSNPSNAGTLSLHLAIDPIAAPNLGQHAPGGAR